MKTLLACLAALPFVAHSETLFLEYEGTVKSADPAPFWSYKPGDEVKGLVKIHTDLAPPPFRSPSQPGLQVWDTLEFPGHDFVGSKLVDLPGRVVDAVVVGHDPEYPNNYFIQDSVDEIIGGVFTGGLQQLHIGVAGDNLIQGDGLVQQFDAIPAKDGSRTWGTFFRRIGHTISGLVTFDLSRVSLTPGGCRP